VRRALAGAALAAWASAAAAHEGLHVGLEAGRQDVIAGARVGEVDVLRQEGKAVFSLCAGYRWRLAERFVVGVEGGVGWMDGDLARNFAGVSIEYLFDRQHHLGGLAGVLVDLGGPTLLYGYVNEVTRTFSAQLQSGPGRIAQKDEQGMLRYGVGIERALHGNLHGRLAVGGGRARFEGPVSRDGGRTVELSAGLAWFFR
jgi:hypothetical protein